MPLSYKVPSAIHYVPKIWPWPLKPTFDATNKQTDEQIIHSQ